MHGLFKFWQTWIKGVESLLYPSKCLGCQTFIETKDIDDSSIENCFCNECLNDDIWPVKEPYCARCGIQLPESHIENHVCGQCLDNPPVPEKIRAFASYKGILKQAIPMFKYQSRLSLSKSFEHMVFKTFLNHFNDQRIDWIIPVPLHFSKLKQRGFNQANLLIRNFETLYSNRFGTKPAWTIDTTILVRQKKTQAQTGFDLKQRKQNLNKAFCVVGPKKVENKTILLVDDVLTTGATCNEAARLLLKVGAEKVLVLALARA